MEKELTNSGPLRKPADTHSIYRLALDIHGIGFKTADTIAQRLGIPRDAIIRAQAGVRHVLQEFADDGHCAVHQGELMETAVTLLEIPITIIAQAVELECQADHLIAEDIEGKPCVLDPTPPYRSGCRLSPPAAPPG